MRRGQKNGGSRRCRQGPVISPFLSEWEAATRNAILKAAASQGRSSLKVWEGASTGGFVPYEELLSLPPAIEIHEGKSRKGTREGLDGRMRVVGVESSHRTSVGPEDWSSGLK